MNISKLIICFLRKVLCEPGSSSLERGGLAKLQEAEIPIEKLNLHWLFQESLFLGRRFQKDGFQSLNFCANFFHRLRIEFVKQTIRISKEWLTFNCSGTSKCWRMFSIKERVDCASRGACFEIREETLLTRSMVTGARNSAGSRTSTRCVKKLRLLFFKLNGTDFRM